MPHAPDNTDSERWRDRARKIRNIAEGIHDLASKRAILKTADEDYEAGVWVPRAEDLTAIQDALERAGVEFIESGVKLKGTGS
jgi:hypothetical protein